MSSDHPVSKTNTIQRLRVRPDLCRGCQACTLACSLYHEGASGMERARLRVIKDIHQYAFAINVCRQCKRAPCVEVCPTGALSIEPTGLVRLDAELCIGCQACVEVCPFQAIFYDEERNICFKCDLCIGREGGPLCAEVCPTEAITWRGGERR